MKTIFVSLALCTLAVGCGGGAPSGFGVNLTVQTDQLPSDKRAQIVSVALHVSGAETYATSIDVSKVTSSEIHIHYVPGVHAGSLVFEVDGLASDRSIVASGASAQVAIVDGKAVDATVSLGLGPQPDLGALANGDKCTMGADCASQLCVDGVCCDTACTGTCEACNLPGTAGTCSPIPANTDPDQECGAKIPPPPPDGGIDDGGTTSVDGGMQLKQPDGGLAVNVQACAGTCSGNRSCNYPGTTTNCGSVFCSASAEIAGMVCDGTGGCNQQLSTCTDYTCDPTNATCRTRCSTDADCQTATDYCNTVTNLCAGKKTNGNTCQLPSECQSGSCSQNVCCNTDCQSPASCNGSTGGVVGQCKCQGLTCAAGVACQLFYRDADNDKFGDVGGNLASGTAAPGCANMPPPSGFVADHTDCDDKDGNVFPGQPKYFYSISAGGTWDYNCDGNPNEKETVEGSCGFCGTSTGSCTTSPTCAASGNSGAFSCVTRFICNPFTHICSPLCLNGTASGFYGSVACGATGTLINCGTCAAAGDGCSTSQGSSKQQGCH